MPEFYINDIDHKIRSYAICARDGAFSGQKELVKFGEAVRKYDDGKAYKIMAGQFDAGAGMDKAFSSHFLHTQQSADRPGEVNAWENQTLVREAPHS